MRKVIVVAIGAFFLAGTALAGFTATNAGPLNSYGPYGTAGNGVFTWTNNQSFVPGSLNFAGDLTNDNTASYLSEAMWRVTNPAGQSVNIQPATGTTWTGTVHVTNAFSGLQNYFTGTSVGNWTFACYESYDDGGPTVLDAHWNNVSFQLNDYQVNPDEAAFLAQLAPGYYLENFDAYTYGSYTQATLPLSGGNGYAYTISAAGGGTNNLYSGDSNMSTDSALDQMVVTFTGAPVTAIGGNFFASDLSGNYMPSTVTLTLSDGQTLTFSPTSAEDFRHFFSTVPITSMTIDAPEPTPGQAPYYWPTMDHFYAGAFVPEPASLLLLVLGGLVARRR